MSPIAGTCACGRTIVIRDDDEHPGVCDICHLQQAFAAEREKLAELQDRSVAMRKHERKMRKTLEDDLAAERERLARIIRELQVEGPEDVQALRVTIVRLENDLEMADKALHDAAGVHKAEMERADRAEAFHAVAAQQRDTEIGRANRAEAEVKRLRGHLQFISEQPCGITGYCLPCYAITALKDS